MIKYIAHRGLKTNAKENTMAAFLDAINGDYVGFECDVRQTKDNKLIIHHDPIYDGKIIRDLNSFDIKNVLFLEDVLNIDTDKMIVIDIKDPLIDVSLFNKELSQFNKDIYVISFHNNVINQLFKLKRNYKVGILNYLLNSKIETKGDFVCLLGLFNNINIINRYKHNNIKLFFYGIDKNNAKDDYPYYIVD